MIYDNPRNREILDGGSYGNPSNKYHNDEEQNSMELALQDELQQPQINDQEINAYMERSVNAMKVVDDVVIKNYLTKLSQMDIVPVSDDLGKDDIILFKINKMVYEKDEYSTDKFISVVSAMTYANISVYLIVDGHKDRTDFFMGIKCNDPDREKSSIADTFKNSLLGQFPGAKVEDLSYIGMGSEHSQQDKLLHRITEAVSVSSCVGIPSYKNSKGEYTNANFIQGIEKFASAMQGKEYTAVVLASNISQNDIAEIRFGYENVYTELSAMATRQLAYSTNESLANALSRTKGYSDSTNISDTEGSSDSESKSHTHSKGTGSTTTNTTGESEDNKWGKAAKMAGPLFQAGSILAATGIGGPAGLIMMGVSAVAGVVGTAKAKQLSKSTSQSESTNSSESDTITNAHTTNKSHTVSKGHSENFSETDGTTSTVGSSKNFTITIQNKHIQEIQKRIDKQLERISLCESTGLWSAGAYFMSYDTDRATAEIGATIFRSIIQGEQSGVESSAINTWYSNNNPAQFKSLLNYVSSLSHPLFKYSNNGIGTEMSMLPTSFLSSKEVAMMIGLPRKSVPGLPVVEHISLAKEVVKLDGDSNENCLQLGYIFDQGVERKANKVTLDIKSLCSHTFVTGSTGCGKSNTIYYLISQIQKQANAPKFLIVEPAKGEYKNVFGNENIYGTNPLITPLLKINPFRFTKGVHVLEHIDKLIEIFNVCWPMYAAMPAILKESILNSYEDCGWDLYNSKNRFSDELFPTFTDLMNELVLTINNSAYSEEVKSNYTGSLVTRVKSLTNGINKEIFSGNEIGDEKLFDENVIVDLSRIGSQETKSLIMGILIMRLSEYRSNSSIESNSNLRHITVLEEAHNILKRCSMEQSMEGSNVAGKSVEMISNAIAEMRTYGEGFVIVDQSPGAVDVSAIRNTNTKIIMRLPEESDRKVAGKSAAMQDNQIDEISKLPTGVAVVYQNDWESPVLCKISKFEGIPIQFNMTETISDVKNAVDIKTEVVKLLLNARVIESSVPDVEKIKTNIDTSDWSTANKWAIYEALEDFNNYGGASVGADENFEIMSRLVSDIVSLRVDVLKLANTAKDFTALTDGLFALIKKSLPDLPNQYYKELSHCLMCDYSLGNDLRMKIYSNWLQSVKQNNS